MTRAFPLVEFGSQTRAEEKQAFDFSLVSRACVDFLA
jgi:hypothetical protein